MSQPYSVYRIRFEDSAEYFGITSQDLARRIEQHTTASHNRGVADRMDTGMDFEVALMAKGISKPEALELERGYIRTGKKVLNLVGPGLPTLQRRTAKKKTQLNVAFQKRTLEEIDQLAKRAEVSMAELVRQIVEREIGRTAKRLDNRAGG